MRTKVKVEGLRETERALADLPRATAKNVLNRVLDGAAMPIEADAQANISVRTGVAREHVVRSKRLNKTSARAVRRANSKSSAEIHVGVVAGKAASGAGKYALVAAMLLEFKHKPWLRPAWDSNKRGALDHISDNLWTEIRKAANRLAKKAARLAKRGGA
jgi:hypothetical protein